MNIWEALFLGMVQGVTEFLPVSSSGHLVLLQKLFGITEPVLVFDTAVHGGTLIAVLVVLRQDIYNIFRRILQPLTLFLIIGTIPAVIAALLFKNQIEAAFASGTFLCFAFMITSALLFLSEKLSRRSPTGSPAGLKTPVQGRPDDEMNWLDALIIGLFQAVAIVPGISRSGATISAAIARRLNRDFAARFSFLLSIPTILGALLLQGRDLIKAGAGQGVAAGTFGGIGVAPLIVGVVGACIAAFFSVRITLKIVRELSLLGFSLYTGILGVIVMIDRFWTHYYF